MAESNESEAPVSSTSPAPYEQGTQKARQEILQKITVIRADTEAAGADTLESLIISLTGLGAEYLAAESIAGMILERGGLPESRPELDELLLRQILILAPEDALIPIYDTRSAGSAAHDLHSAGNPTEGGPEPATDTAATRPQRPATETGCAQPLKVRPKTLTRTVTVTGGPRLVRAGEEFTVAGLVYNPICGGGMRLFDGGDEAPTGAATTWIAAAPEKLADPRTAAHWRPSAGFYRAEDLALSCEWLSEAGISIPPLQVTGTRHAAATRWLFADMSGGQVRALLLYLYDYFLGVRQYAKSRAGELMVAGVEEGEIAPVSPLAGQLWAGPQPAAMRMPGPQETANRVLRRAEALFPLRFNEADPIALAAGKFDARIGPDTTEGELEQRANNARISREERARRQAEEALVTVYLRIVADKLEPQAGARLKAALKARPLRPTELLELLDKKQRKTVELEYGREERYAQEVVGNKCPHVPALARFRREVGPRKRTLFDRLLTFADISGQELSALTGGHPSDFTRGAGHPSDFMRGAGHRAQRNQAREGNSPQQPAAERDLPQLSADNGPEQPLVETPLQTAGPEGVLADILAPPPPAPEGRTSGGKRAAHGKIGSADETGPVGASTQPAGGGGLGEAEVPLTGPVKDSSVPVAPTQRGHSRPPGKVANGSATAFVKCSQCGFDLLCPHVIALTRLEFSRFGGVSAAEERAVMTPFIERESVLGQCKICGEVISAYGSFESDDDLASEKADYRDNELRQFIWGEVAMLMRNVQFSALVNTPRIISKIRDSIYPFVLAVQKQVRKSKTSSAEEVRAKERVFIAFYALASIARLILTSAAGGGVQANFKGFQVKDRKKAAAEVIRKAIDIFAEVHNITRRSVPGLTLDVAKNKIVEAFRALDSPAVLEERASPRGLLRRLERDPVFEYIREIWLYAGQRRAGGPLKKQPTPTDMLGLDNTQALERADNAFADAAFPPGFESEFERYKAAAETLAADPWKYVGLRTAGKTGGGSGKGHAQKSRQKANKSGPEAANSSVDESALRNAREWIIGASFGLFLRRVKMPRLRTDKDYVDAAVQLDIDSDNVRAVEAGAREVELVRTAKNMGSFPWRHSTRRRTKLTVSLGRIFDEDGFPHRWEARPVPPLDVALGILSAGSATHKTTCAVCGVTPEKAPELDQQRIRSALAFRHELAGFSSFYENRCPEGELHEIVAGACTKCGLEPGARAASTSGGPVEQYYQKYKRKYAQELAEGVQAEAPPVAAPAADKNTAVAVTEAYLVGGVPLARWAYNFNIFLDLAAKLKINHRLLTGLGAFERQEYDAVLNGTFLPPEVHTRDSTRIYKLVAHARYFIAEYGKLRALHKSHRPAPYFLDMLDQVGVSRHNLEMLEEKLPPIRINLDATVATARTALKPRELVEYFSQLFCELCVRIWGQEELPELCRAFVERTVRHVLREEEVLTAPGKFNWAIIFGTRENVAHSDANVEDDVSASTKESTASALDRNMDLDDFGREEGDDEEYAKIRVGEEYGLD